jgi:hypothetical protein
MKLQQSEANEINFASASRALRFGRFEDSDLPFLFIIIAATRTNYGYCLRIIM